MRVSLTHIYIFSFLKQHLHAGPPETADVEALRNEVFELKQKNEQLSMENAELKQKVSLRNFQ